MKPTQHSMTAFELSLLPTFKQNNDEQSWVMDLLTIMLSIPIQEPHQWWLECLFSRYSPC